jgi:hypothetical protein
MPLRTRIEIGIVNNMPDGALVPTERQFSGLIEQASGDLDINISLHKLESLPRQLGTLSAIGQTYRPAREVRAYSPDALIVTRRRAARTGPSRRTLLARTRRARRMGAIAHDLVSSRVWPLTRRCSDETKSSAGVSRSSSRESSRPRLSLRMSS